MNADKFNKTGHKNIAIGKRTSEGTGAYNVMIGIGAGASYNPATDSVNPEVVGTDNVLIGTDSGSSSVIGTYNTFIGAQSGTNLGMMCTGLGFRSGSESSGTVPSGSNNIYINAGGEYLHSTNNNGCYIKPIRPTSSAPGLKSLMYDPVTSEVVYLA